MCMFDINLASEVTNTVNITSPGVAVNLYATLVDVREEETAS